MSTDSQKRRANVAIVIGASKGIGAAIATHLGHAGASVVINYSSSKAGADRVVAKALEKRLSGPLCLPIRFLRLLALLNGVAIDIVVETRLIV